MQALSDHSLFLLSINRFCYDVGRTISKKYRLTVNERNTLLVLSNIEVHSIKELSGYLAISKTNTSKVLSSLEKKNLIIRIFNKDDKRFIQLLLTEDGKKISDMVSEEINRLFKIRLSEIPNELSDKILDLVEEYQELLNIQLTNSKNH